MRRTAEISDLLEEPSASSLDLDLDLGTLVVKAQKNIKLNIHSALGTAGIREQNSTFADSGSGYPPGCYQSGSSPGGQHRHSGTGA